MKHLIGGSAAGTLVFFFMLLRAQKNPEFTLKDAAAILMGAMPLGLLVGLAVWGLF